MTGAGHLAAAAAQRAGAGHGAPRLPGRADDPARPTEAVGLELPSVGWARSGPRRRRRGSRRSSSAPGSARASPTEAAILDVLAGTDRPAVVDGDGLTALGRRCRSARHPRRPDGAHPARRRVRAPRRPPAGSRPPGRRPLPRDRGRRRRAPQGPDDGVAAPDGEVRVVADGDARLATAGTGDVLSGTIGALLARGIAPFDAAAAGAWLHARAGALRPGRRTGGVGPGRRAAQRALRSSDADGTRVGGRVARRDRGQRRDPSSVSAPPRSARW